MVENETEVMNLLGNIGFKMVRCEDLSFEEQVKTFYNAETVVSPHGAGLTNLLFAKDNTKVLELRSPHYFGRCYYYLSGHLGFPYYSLYGEGKLPTTKEEVGSSLYANMKINIPRLKQTLDLMDVK
jgi:capsular polysaccharide biosynthesis protein